MFACTTTQARRAVKKAADRNGIKHGVQQRANQMESRTDGGEEQREDDLRAVLDLDGRHEEVDPERARERNQRHSQLLQRKSEQQRTQCVWSPRIRGPDNSAKAAAEGRGVMDVTPQQCECVCAAT